ncbi:hypothetical protein GS682_17975 [Nostoc sp. B(2019)]|nr:hypothetical protein [Nostoc sp. B(2019)]
MPCIKPLRFLYAPGVFRAIALHGCQHPQARYLMAKLQQNEHFRVVTAALESASG